MKFTKKVINNGAAKYIPLPKHIAEFLEIDRDSKLTMELKGKKLIINKED